MVFTQCVSKTPVDLKLKETNLQKSIENERKISNSPKYKAVGIQCEMISLKNVLVPKDKQTKENQRTSENLKRQKPFLRLGLSKKWKTE